MVLSYGATAFTSDRRFGVEGPSGDRPHSWLLHVDPVLAKDQGLYECQVNTRGKLSLVFKLNVARKSRIMRISSRLHCALIFVHTHFLVQK